MQLKKITIFDLMSKAPPLLRLELAKCRRKGGQSPEATVFGYSAGGLSKDFCELFQKYHEEKTSARRIKRDNGWRLFDSAPLDRKIIVTKKGTLVFHSTWWGLDWNGDMGWVTRRRRKLHYSPTHWMECPELP